MKCWTDFPAYLLFLLPGNNRELAICGVRLEGSLDLIVTVAGRLCWQVGNRLVSRPGTGVREKW